eukprot:XP_001705768.1 Hypothetical protein GL50803_32070 [Giardia lamblia ATCC 50803]
MRDSSRLSLKFLYLLRHSTLQILCTGDSTSTVNCVCITKKSILVDATDGLFGILAYLHCVTHLSIENHTGYIHSAQTSC